MELQVAVCYNPGMTPLDTDTRALARKLSSRNPAERASAERQLESLHGEPRRLIAQQLVSDVKATRHTVCTLSKLVFAWGICFVAFTGFEGYLGISRISFLLIACVLMALLYALTAAWGYFWFGLLRRQYSALMQALAESSDPRLIGILLDAINFTPRQSRRLLRETLERSIAQIGPDDTDLVTREQIAYLAQKVSEYWAIVGGVTRSSVLDRYEERVRLTQTMIRLLAIVGDTKEMAQLERLARKRAKNEAQRRIQDAIVEVLPGWKARLEGRRNPQTLLRSASASVSDDSQSLLRAAGASSTEPQELLRPGMDSER